MQNIIVYGRGSIGVRHAKNLEKLNFNPIFLRVKKKKSIPNDNLNVPEVFSFDEALKYNPIGAVISTPTIFHTKHALEFLEKNIPVYIEKPLGYKINSDHLNMLENYSKKTIIHGGFNYKYSPEINSFKKKFFEMKKKIKEAKIIWKTDLKEWHPWEDYRESYAFRPELGGGVIHTCSHEINFLVELFPNAKLKKVKKSLFENICTSCEANYVENLINIQLNLDFMSNKKKREISFTLQNDKVIKFDFNKYSEDKIKDISCYESVKDFVNCIKKQSMPKSNYEDSKKTYLYCESLLNE